MRSFREITFRLKQEGGNLFRLIQPPHADCRMLPPLAAFPDPSLVAENLRGTPYAADVVRIAEKILAHRFPLM